jgi:methyltransferase (TIGR00027 family)
MLQSLSSITYPVADLAQARAWYSEVLNREPVIDSPLAAVFAVGNCMLGLLATAAAPVRGREGTVAYWSVDDIDAAWQRLLDSGATPQCEIYFSSAGARMARVTDPFGNVLGLTSRTSAATPRSLDDQPSDSALGVALWRAVAAKDPREEIRGSDHLADAFLTDEFRKLVANPAACGWLKQKVPGNYEFFLARTAWLDEAVRDALQTRTPQIVFLGAGYDSRAYRFSLLIRGTRIFELDIGPTQRRKRQFLEQAGIAVPEQLTFVPIDFTRDRLEDVLTAAGFDPSLRTLFVWEGVTYYLPAEAIDRTLDFVRTHSAAGSLLCFDYLADAPDMMDRYGVKAAITAMQTVYLAEPAKFRIPEGAIEAFLSERGYDLIEHLTEKDMEKRYLTLRDGSLAGKAVACFRLVKASASASPAR